jgi:hypothetical protein
LELFATKYEGEERRRKQRRIGAGRRAFSDRRVEERRFDVWSIVADERRCNPDRRKAKRRLKNRRKYPNRRVARVERKALEIELVSDTPSTL